MKHFFKHQPLIIILAFLIPAQVLADVPESVNFNAVYYNSVARCKTNTDTGIFIGSDAIETAFRYFVSQGLSAEQSAAIIGNLRWESGGGVLDPTSQEVHKGVPTPIHDEGFGIAQWTYPSRQDNLVAYAASVGKPVNTLEPQLGFLWKELGESYGATLAKLKTDTSIAQAVVTFQTGYESPAPDQAHTSDRIRLAEQTFALYASTAPSAGGQTAGTIKPSATPTCGGGLGVSNDFTFPQKTTKEAIKNVSGEHWCYDSQASCHHDYRAADIFNAIGTTNVAAVGGTVLSATDTPCTGDKGVPRVQIKGTDGIYYYYTHMSSGSIKVHDGQVVKAGDELGTVGPSSCAEGSQPHLHFQMSSVPITNTEDTAERTKYIDPQPNLTASFQKLPGLQP